VDHRARDLGHSREVIGGAGGDRAEHDLLRGAAAEQHGHVVDQLLARLEVAVLLGQVQRVAERAAAGDDRDLVHAVHARQQLGADRVTGLVEGDDPALMVVERAARLHAGHHALERGVEIGVHDHVAVLAGGEDRSLVAEVGEIGARQAGGLAGDQAEVDVADRLAPRVHAHDLLAAGDVGRGDEDLAVEAARAQQRRVELLEQVGRGDDHEVVGRLEAVHLDQQLVERLLALGVVVRAALTADRVDLVDEDDRRALLARHREQPADARGPEAGEHLDEGGGRLREEVRARLVRHGLGQQRLARPGRAVEQDAARDLRPELPEALGVAHELDDLLQLGLGLVAAGDLVPADRPLGGGLDLDRLGLGHHLERPPDEEDQQAHEDDGGPRLKPLRDLVPRVPRGTLCNRCDLCEQCEQQLGPPCRSVQQV
jgi:hypothetical protein